MDPKTVRIEIFMDGEKSRVFFKDFPPDLKPFVYDFIDEIYHFSNFLRQDLKKRPNPPVKLSLNVFYTDLI